MSLYGYKRKGAVAAWTVAFPSQRGPTKERKTRVPAKSKAQVKRYQDAIVKDLGLLGLAGLVQEERVLVIPEDRAGVLLVAHEFLQGGLVGLLLGRLLEVPPPAVIRQGLLKQPHGPEQRGLMARHLVHAI